ncbi:hypothetical protein BpHYR1_053931 [Brachionus plicatilis]|uniref:Transmembrane protein n=1 Tax=Brachionus plicatilis TaxID=10195 RepID=A0A3M7R152_BRAPC|nr:hypothetical protein BpHYR1_053931 [Brachionus plicatilis]
MMVLEIVAVGVVVDWLEIVVVVMVICLLEIVLVVVVGLLELVVVVVVGLLEIVVVVVVVLFWRFARPRAFDLQVGKPSVDLQRSIECCVFLINR